MQLGDKCEMMVKGMVLRWWCFHLKEISLEGEALHHKMISWCDEDDHAISRWWCDGEIKWEVEIVMPISDELHLLRGEAPSKKEMERIAGRLATSTEWRMNEGDGAAFWQPNNPEGFGGGTPPISTELLFCSFYQKENTRDGTSRLEKRKACCKHPRRVLILFPKE